METSTYRRWMEAATIGTLLGAPTLAMPAGFNKAGLPISIQVIARHHDDSSLMDLAHAWEQQTGFVQHRLSPLLSACPRRHRARLAGLGRRTRRRPRTTPAAQAPHR
ncbi:amidase family protein [Streptomyces sp. NPDC048385]|uniref:amidase family protein n=2 Tax=Streptomyces TaxID=1883 RepID=UPI00342F71D9